MNGPMTKDAIDLHTLGIALINIQSIFDRSYCHYTGHKKISPLERSNFKLVAHDVQRGSIIFTAGLTAFTIQQSLAITQTIDPKFIMSATFTAFKYLYGELSSQVRHFV
jgi:hypothetical protein